MRRGTGVLVAVIAATALPAALLLRAPGRGGSPQPDGGTGTAAREGRTHPEKGREKQERGRAPGPASPRREGAGRRETAAEDQEEVRLSAVDRESGTGLAGVRFRFLPLSGGSGKGGPSQGRTLPVTAVTVAGGQARVVLPREVPAWRIAVEHPEFFSMYDTRYYRPGPDVLVAYMARKFMIAGEVIDSRGDPVEGARVILVHPSLDAAGKTEDLLHRSLCSTGKNGDFGATLEEGIPAEGFFVASARGWLPQGIKVDPVPPPDGCIHLHFRLQEGRVVEGRFIVRGEEEIPAIRLSLRQATHPLFPEWKVQPMPPRAGEKIGLRVETVTADGKGRFRSPGWPPGAKIQVFIFNPKDHDLVLESVEDGLQLGRRQALVDMALNRRPLFHVFLRRSPRIRVSGRVEGFSAAERAGIRFQVLTLEGRSGYLVRLHWEGCRFHGELSPGASYMDYLQPFRVKMSLPGERNVKFFGPFCLRWETTIGDLFYDRHGDGESRE